MDLRSRIIQLCTEMKKSGEQSFYNDVAKIVNKEYGVDMTGESIRGVCRRYRKQNNLDDSFNPISIPDIADDKQFSDGFDGYINPNKKILTINSDDTRTSQCDIEVEQGVNITPELLLEKHGFDPRHFKLISAKNSQWDSKVKGGHVINLYSSKISVAPRNEIVWDDALFKKIFDNIGKTKKISQYKSNDHVDNGYALVLPIVDLHYAMWASKSATGDQYDTNVARKCLFSVIDDVLEQVGNRKFEKIILTIGNDLLNFDTKSGTTTAGTQQDNDCEIEDAVVEVTDILIDIIEQLKKISKVEVIHIPSNHDRVVSFGIANTLRAVYRDDDCVEVDADAIERKYKVFGRTLLGFAHDIKADKVNNIVQEDARYMMMDTDRTVYFLAHLHHEECKDVGGTDVRRLPTISKKSRWAYEKGYGSVRKNQAFIVDSEHGISQIIYSFV